mgnify:FL=1
MAWKRGCKTTDVPENSLKKFWVEGIPLGIANYGSGFRAFPPVCPHMEEPLENSGILANCILTCTKHLWAWNLASLEMQGETEKPLQTYECKLENGEVLAFVDKEIVYEFEDEDEMDDDAFFKQ